MWTATVDALKMLWFAVCGVFYVIGVIPFFLLSIPLDRLGLLPDYPAEGGLALMYIGSTITGILIVGSGILCLIL